MADWVDEPIASSVTQQTGDYTDVPVRTYDYTPVKNVSADRDELVKQWLSTDASAGPAKLAEFKAKAENIGMSLDELIAAGEDQKGFSERWATKLYRNGGPLWRGAMNSADSTQTFLTNMAYRGLSNIPGWENLSTKADENNRALQTREAIGDALNRGGTVGELIGGGKSAFLGNVAQGFTDIATAAAIPTGGGAAVAEGASAAEAAAASKVAAMTASKKAATYFGLKTAERELTVATDHGLSPEMRMVHAGVMGGSTALFTYGFGQWAQTLGLSTAEQAVAQNSPAVERLMERTGLSQAIGGMALSAGEQAGQETTQMLWGTLAGTDNTDAGFERITKAAATGAVMRGATEVLPAVQAYRDAYRKTQEAMPDTVKGTLDAQKAASEGKADAKPPENASENYKAAFSSELDELNRQKTSAQGTLKTISIGESNLADELAAHTERTAKVNEAKSQEQNFNPNAITAEMRAELKRKYGLSDETIDAATVSPLKSGQSAPISAETQAVIDNLANEQKALQAKGDELQSKRKAAEAELKAVQDKLQSLDDAAKTEIKSKVIENAETERIATELDKSRERLTRAENDLNAKFREQEGFAALPETKRLSAEHALQNARDGGLVARADEIAQDILSKERAIEPNEQAGLVEAAQHRSDRIAELTKVKNDPAKSEGERTDAAIALDNAKKSADTISIAINRGRAKAAQSLALGRYDANNIDPANVREYASRVKGGELTTTQSDALTNAAVQLKDIEFHARKAVEELEAKVPLTKDGFIYREILRAERSKGSPLTKEENAVIAKRATKLYDEAGDIRSVDQARQREVADDLYIKGIRLRARLDQAIKDLEPKTFAKSASKVSNFGLGLWRGWLTGFDASLFLRQGLLYPRSWGKGWRDFLKSFKSGRDTLLIDRDLHNDTFVKWVNDVPDGSTKLALSHQDTPLSLQEGTMFDVTHEALPVVGPFARAFRTGLNALRVDAAKRIVDANGGMAKWDSANKSALNEFINCGSGRGTLGQFENAAGPLANVFIGPRFFMSRLQYLTGWPLAKAAYRGDKLASSVMLKTYAKQIAGLAVMTGFAEMAGKAAFGPDAVKFYRNPLSDDPEERFNVGRLKIGGTMIDITGGLARPYRYMTALAEPLVASHEDRRSLKKTGDTLQGIARGSLAPLPSALWSMSEFYSGQRQGKVSPSDYILPWSVKDITNALENEGLDKGAAISAFSLFGAGSYTSEKK